MDVSLGYEKYDRSKKDTNNSRNGSYKKQVKSSFGPIDLAIPRDRQGEQADEGGQGVPRRGGRRAPGRLLGAGAHAGAFAGQVHQAPPPV